MRKIISLSGLLPATALADPLDRGEAYTTRGTPPEWMDGIDFTWLLVDYGVFAAILIGFSWMMTKRMHLFESFEGMIRWPFSLAWSTSNKLPVVLRELAQGIVGLAVLFVIVAWVIFCQWLNHQHLGAIAMAGLALEAILLVRLIKRGEKPLLKARP